MSLIATSEGGDRTLCPEGSYPAVCVKVIDQGTQTVEWSGIEKQQHKVLVAWELPTVPNPDNDDKPYLMWQNYTASLDDRSNLYKHLVAWRGRAFTPEELIGFELKKILGAPCILTVVWSKDEKWANVGGISGLVAGMPKPKPTMPLASFDLDEPDLELFNDFSEKLQQKICSSVEAFRIGLSPGCTRLNPQLPDGGDTTDHAAPGGPHVPIDESEIPF